MIKNRNEMNSFYGCKTAFVFLNKKYCHVHDIGSLHYTLLIIGLSLKYCYYILLNKDLDKY